MSQLGLFLLGTGITAVVGLAVAPLLWAAVLDGRHDREQRRLRLVAAADDRTPPDSRAA
jgi:hypothetical protein